MPRDHNFEAFLARLKHSDAFVQMLDLLSEEGLRVLVDPVICSNKESKS